MSSSPLPIRRAVPDDTLSLSRSAKEIYGTTPGGTRIVYSREQLLSLASSPLSKTPPHIPAEISRSPEKNGNVLVASYRSNGVTGRGGAMEKTGHASAGQVFGGIHQNGSIGQTALLSRSPPNNSSRSPGNAFNFGNNSMSSNGINHSTSFKERMASTQQQSTRQAPLHPRSDGALPTSSNGAPKEEANGAAHGDEQFNMDM